ncbi:MAG: ATP-binding domain-containing protein [Deltaproteobacteria bacterium]|nr:ATP-binding domain-containing protein [Deltaproteobacteria bacterium]
MVKSSSTISQQPLSQQDQRVVEEEQAVLGAVVASLPLAQGAAGEDSRYRESRMAGESFDLAEEIGEAREGDLPQLLGEAARMRAVGAHRAKEGPVAPVNPESPYFGHLRVEQDGRVKDILIGSTTLVSHKLAYPIIDWRNAPISKIYYVYQEGDEYEEEIAGRLVEGKVLARRTVTIRGGELLRVEGGGQVFQRVAGPPTGEWMKTDAHRARLAGGEMSSALPPAVRLGAVGSLGVGQPGLAGQDRHLPEITGLIDPAQWELMNAPSSEVVVMDGGAGSGKTTVGLHRMALLAHREPQRFAPRDMMVVVAGRALREYISRVLPSMGVFGARIEVYEELVNALRRRHFPTLEGEPCDTTPFAVVRFKQHPAAWEVLKRRAEEARRGFQQAMAAALEGTASGERALQVWATLEREPFVGAVGRFARWVAGRQPWPEFGVFGDDWVAQQRLARLVAEVLPNPETPAVAVVALWEEAFLNPARLTQDLEQLAPGVFSAQEIQTIAQWTQRGQALRHEWRQAQALKKTGEPEREGRLGPDELPEEPEMPRLDREDDTLLLLLHRETLGPLRGRKQRPFLMNHLMVDEAQDFSPLELDVLIGLAARPFSLTLAGDAAQRMFPHKGTDGWEDILARMGLTGRVAAPLQVGYRSTAEIMAFAQGVLGPLAPKERVWRPTRGGAPVEWLTFSSRGEAVAALADALRSLARREPAAYTALIARRGDQADVYFEGLLQAEVPRVRRVADQDFAFQPGVEVTDITQVKGLEFDYVVLLDVDRESYPDDAISRHMLHVGVTRAAHQLWLVCCQEPSPILPPVLGGPTP